MTPSAKFARTAAVTLSLVCGASAAFANAIVIPIADRFDVSADGASVVLDILANDIDYDPAAPPVTRVSAPPACAMVDISDSAQAVVAVTPECPDTITFDYCVETEIGCLDAAVTLVVVSRPDPVEIAPVVAVEQAAEPIEVAATPEPAPAVAVEQAAEPIEVAATPEPTPVVAVEQIAEPIEVAATPEPVVAVEQAAEPIEIAAAPEPASPALVELVIEPVEASTVSIRPMRIAPASPVEIDPVLRAQIAAALAEDDSIACDVSATVVARPGGFNMLEARSPCRAGELILVVFDGLRYTVRLDADGRGAVNLYSLTPQAEAVIHTADGARIAVEVIAVGLRGADRVIVAWESFWDADLSLIALNDPTWSAGAVVQAADAGGELKVVLDMSNDTPTALGVVVSDAPCGARVAYRLLRSVDGQVRQDLRRIAVAANCDDAPAAVRLAER